MSGNTLKFQNNTSSLGPDNCVFSSYLPDGTLMTRQFRSVRTRTVVRVNSKGDTIVRTVRELVIDHTRYRGDWEINGSVWRLNTPEGIARVVNSGATSDGGRTFTHLWYVRDRLGSVRTVVDDEGTIRQCTMFYPSGLPVQLFGTKRVTDRAHIGNRWSNFAGLGWHDNIAHWHDAILDRFTIPDPKAADYPSFSPCTHCAANPLRFTDPTGMDIYRFDEAGNYLETIPDSENADIVQIGHNTEIGFVSAIDEVLSDNGVFKLYFDTIEDNNKLSFITIRGDENAYKVFEMFAKITGIEWQLIQTGIEGDKGLNFLGTSYQETRSAAGRFLYNNQLLYGYTIRNDYHNHPDNTEDPSPADVSYATDVLNATGQNVQFYLYVKESNILINYTPKLK